MPITSTGAIYYFKDDLGNPLVGGKVYTYEYNTSQPKDTYKTGARITPHTNPVILNDSGSVEWYLKDNYTLRVYDANDVFLEEQHIVAPSKAVLDVVSDKLDTLIADLKEAAYRDTGTAAAQVPLNSNLGTAAYKSFSEDANGFIREEGSTSEVVIKDAAGVATVNGIQAGVDAPKIAYKKLTGVLSTTSSLTIPHGLSGDKILEVRAMFSVFATEFIPDSYPLDTAHIAIRVLGGSIVIAPALGTSAPFMSGKPVKILITYEV